MAKGANPGGHILVVDDNKINLMMLTRALTSQGYQVTTAMDGGEALEFLYSPAAETIDVVLLDILMPDLDGYQLLGKIKEKEDLRHIPVIMISALDEMDSVIRCIEMGATDYLHKPYNPALLEARLNASLAEKRLRDLEIEYLDQVGYVVAAAESIEASAYDPESLKGVANREDALGNLARVFQSMADEIHLREQRLKQQLEQLRIDVEDMKKSMSEPLSVYIPMDRRQALVHGITLPESASGSTLFVDISGFTPLSENLAKELGRKRGAEELTRILNQVYGALIEVVHQYHGSVVGFSGDAITCYFDDDEGLLAVACGLKMQKTMGQFSAISTPIENTSSLGIKIAAVAGSVRRFLVGDPQIQNIEVLAGRTLDLLAAGEHLADRGDVLVHKDIINGFGGSFELGEERADSTTGESFIIVTDLIDNVPPQPWIELRKDVLTEEQCRPWLLPAVYEQARSGARGYLSEFRAAAALFLSFTGIDYDHDEQAGEKLDRFTRWVQSVIAQYDGSLLQLTMGDKGSYLYAVFGAPIAHNDDAIRAVYAALALQDVPLEFDWIHEIKIGVTQGQMRTGSYGSSSRRTYGAQGDKVNLAARLMQAADQGILCDRSIYLATQARLGFEELEPMVVKGVKNPVEMYRPTGEKIRLERKRVPLMGRTAEQIEIGRILQGIRHGPSKVVILEGEAGIGKTRLVEKFMTYAADLGFTYCQSNADSGSGQPKYHPWREIFSQIFKLDNLSSDQERINRLTAALDGSVTGSLHEQGVDIIQSMLVSNTSTGITQDEIDEPKLISEIFIKLLQAGIKNSPAVIILENAQDLDHESWELIQSASMQVSNLVLVVATRPLTEPLPSAHLQLMRAPNTIDLSLKGLSAEEAYLLACEHLEVVSLPPDLVEIVDRAAGNPQFVEEMVYILRDDGYIQVEAGECLLLPHVDLESIVFPTTAEGLIKSRLDRLSPSEQLTLKIASVIGEEFSLDLLIELYPLESDRPFIVNHLETFTNLDLVSPCSYNHSYTFRDEITYHAVYSSMLFSQRRQLHRQLAERIEENEDDELLENYALLADHWRKADDTAKAIDYLEKAGQRALEQGDYEKAEYYFKECLELDSSSAVLSTEFVKRKLRGDYLET
jgi:DNA-binding response OmpR family regulator/class 3 adenylate cyclase/tetratricopeptide (TPR) repeat protein